MIHTCKVNNGAGGSSNTWIEACSVKSGPAVIGKEGAVGHRQQAVGFIQHGMIQDYSSPIFGTLLQSSDYNPLDFLGGGGSAGKRRTM